MDFTFPFELVECVGYGRSCTCLVFQAWEVVGSSIFCCYVFGDTLINFAKLALVVEGI